MSLTREACLSGDVYVAETLRGLSDASGRDLGTAVDAGESGRPSTETFIEFYRGAFAEVYAYVYQRCGGIASVAEDLTQETFLAAVRAVNGGNVAGLDLPWVIGIARHKLVDHYRRREREERRLSVLVRQEVTEPPEPDNEVVRERALSALDAMPAVQRAALVLRYLDGLSVPEIAAILGKSVQATESILARGRSTFRRRYLEGGDD